MNVVAAAGYELDSVIVSLTASALSERFPGKQRAHRIQKEMGSRWHVIDIEIYDGGEP
jgi:hypothetical protein